MAQASSDSDEIAQIGQPQDQMGNNSVDSAQRAKLAEQQPNGHHDPTQRRFYLLLLSLAIGSALASLILILVWMLKYAPTTGFGLSDPKQLANLHPVLMLTFMISLNMYAVLVYRTHYSSAKEKLKRAHAVLAGVNIVMSLLGVFAMFRAHQLMGQANFYTLHSWIGVVANGLYVAQFALGFVSFMRPGLSQARRQALMPLHRKLGAAILVVACAAAVTGILELAIWQAGKDYSQFVPLTYVANFAGLSIVLMAFIALYLLVSSHWLRPKLPEEEPLKR